MLVVGSSCPGAICPSRCARASAGSCASTSTVAAAAAGARPAHRLRRAALTALLRNLPQRGDGRAAAPARLRRGHRRGLRAAEGLPRGARLDPGRRRRHHGRQLAGVLPRHGAHSRSEPALSLYPDAFAPLGYGLPAAIGAKLAAPGRDVVALVGDSAFLFSVGALDRGAGGRRLLVVVVENGGYQESRRRWTGGVPPVGVSPLPDPVAVATAFGARGARELARRARALVPPQRGGRQVTRGRRGVEDELGGSFRLTGALGFAVDIARGDQLSYSQHMLQIDAVVALGRRGAR